MPGPRQALCSVPRPQHVESSAVGPTVPPGYRHLATSLQIHTYQPARRPGGPSSAYIGPATVMFGLCSARLPSPRPHMTVCTLFTGSGCSNCKC